jgi:hypothetical protein
MVQTLLAGFKKILASLAQPLQYSSMIDKPKCYCSFWVRNIGKRLKTWVSDVYRMSDLSEVEQVQFISLPPKFTLVPTHPEAPRSDTYP